MPEPPHEHGTAHSGVGYEPPRVVPADADLRRAAEVLNAGRAGRDPGRRGRAAARRTRSSQSPSVLGAGVAKALLGKPALPDDLPFVTGSIGLLGTQPSWDLMQGCDTLLMVGSGFPYAEFLPEEGQARGVQIDIDARMLGLRYPMEVNLVGDSADDAARAAAAARAQGRPLLARGGRARRRRLVGDARGARDGRADPINPQRVFRELSPRLPDGLPAGRRLGHGDQLVRARPEAARGHVRVAVGHAGDDGLRHALRDRRQVRAPGPPGASRWRATARCR